MAGPILSTSRVRLDEWRESDFELLYALHSDPRVQRGYPFPASDWAPQATAQRLERYTQEQERYGITKWKMSLLSGAFVGRAGWSPWTANEIELGYAVLPAFQGQGLATEVASSLVGWAKANRPEKLVGFALTDNLASRRILERVGMTFEGSQTISNALHAFYRLIE